MEKINQKLAVIKDALKTLDDGIKLFNEYHAIVSHDPTERNEKIFLSMRDSMIQRFEYCTDLLWKLLKVYLEEVEKVELSLASPRGIIRETVAVKTITEQESDICMEMITNRNQTSHIYHEETAESIARKVPEFYVLMKMIVDKIQKRVPKK